jgi:hypothetical protein
MSHEVREDYEPEPRKRRARGCLCELVGYPGQCPGADQCPYSGLNEDDEDDDADRD